MSVNPSAPSRRRLPSLPPRQQEQASVWRSNPERMAWVILLSAFLIFVVLAVSVPLAIRYTIHNATVAEEVQFNSTVGTVLLYPPRAQEPIAITGHRDDISEESRIVTTGQSTQGVLELALVPNSNEALGTVHLYSGTTLTIDRLRRPRFSNSPKPYQVHLKLQEGRVRLFTNSGDLRPLIVTVETPHGEMTLREGSYNVSVSPTQTDVTVRQGEAILTYGDGQTVTIEPGLRTWMSADAPPQTPISAERNLVANGDFSRPLTDTWQPYNQAGENVVPGKVDRTEQDGRWVAHFVRRGEEGVHTEVGIIQTIDQDVNGYDRLQVKLDVKLIHQSLPGAGTMSSEFPLRFEIDYTDVYGKDLKWGYGFYFKEPQAGVPPIIGEQILPFVWYSYESPNLMELLADTQPARINSIRVYASGHNYEAMLSEIALNVE